MGGWGRGRKEHGLLGKILYVECRKLGNVCFFKKSRRLHCDPTLFPLFAMPLLSLFLLMAFHSSIITLQYTFLFSCL